MSGLLEGIRRRAYDLQRWIREERVARRAVVHPAPKFVLGMQKSGTSAIAGLLSLRTGVPAAVDLAREWRRSTIVAASRSRRGFDRFVRRNAADFSRRIVKEPSLTFVHEHLLRRWPESDIAIVVRDPVSTIRSVLERLGLPGDLESMPAASLEAVPQPWRLVLDNRWLGVDSEHYIDQLSRRWCLAAELALEHRDRWQVVRYEDFSLDKVTVVDRMADHFGLPVVADIDAFLDRPFQPRGARRDPEAVFGDNLQRIIDSTRPLARRLGYHE